MPGIVEYRFSGFVEDYCIAAELTIEIFRNVHIAFIASSQVLI